MKYYDMHDDVYQGLRDKGAVSWDGETDVHNIFNHHINEKLEKHIHEFFPNTSNLCSLDLGTGTGPCALYLSNIGFKSSGFDVSPAAIEMAKENAKGLKVEVDFFVGDITSLGLNAKVDLIVDSSLLHCLTYDKDRKEFYDLIKRVININGYVFIHTMIQSDDMSDLLSKKHLIFKDDTLWSTGKDSWDMDYQHIDGKQVFQHRRILSQESLEKEFSDNVLKVITSRIDHNPRNTNTYIAWLQLE